MATKDKIVNLEDLKVAYDDLNGKNSDSKSAIKRLVGNTEQTLTWKKGVINSSGVEDDTNAYRICSPDFIAYNSNFIIFILIPNALVGITFYNADGTRLSGTSMSRGSCIDMSGAPAGTAKIKLNAGLYNSDSSSYYYITDERKATLEAGICMAAGDGITNGLLPYNRQIELSSTQKTKVQNSIGLSDVITSMMQNNTMYKRGTIDAGTSEEPNDLNNYTDTGFYFIANSQLDPETLLNAPIYTDGFASFCVTHIGNYKAQIYQTKGHSYWRLGHTSSWYDWQEVANNTDVTALLNAFESITEPSRNLWLWGDQEITEAGGYTKIVGANIPGGTAENPKMYTLSATITRESTANCRIVFYKNSVSSGNVVGNPYISADGERNNTQFGLTGDANIMIVYGGLNSGVSQPALWHNIQLEEGESATEYTEPTPSAIDYLARARSVTARLGRQVLMKNATIVGDGKPISAVLPAYNSFSETPIIRCDATFTRSSGVEDYPRIQLKMKNARNLPRFTTWYMIGNENHYEIKEWRAPAYIWGDQEVSYDILVPQGCTLTIREMTYRYDSSIERITTSGTRFYGRPGNCNMVPELSVACMQMALRHGYDTFVVIPKISSDGVWFAYHDDTWVTIPIEDQTITPKKTPTKLVNPDGTAIVTNLDYENKRFDQIPFTYLSQFRNGGFSTMFMDEGLMKLEECFAFLAKTGMKLRFSLHPSVGINKDAQGNRYENDYKLVSLKKLVQKYGLLKDLTMIVNDIPSLFAVFGNDIGGYCFPNSNGASWAEGAENPVNQGFVDAQAAKTAYNITVPISCGLWNDSLFADKVKAEALVSQILDEGFTAEAFGSTRSHLDGTNSVLTWSEEFRWLMSIGITGFTDGYNTSIGLNW